MESDENQQSAGFVRIRDDPEESCIEIVRLVSLTFSFALAWTFAAPVTARFDGFSVPFTESFTSYGGLVSLVSVKHSMRLTTNSQLLNVFNFAIAALLNTARQPTQPVTAQGPDVRTHTP